MSKGRETFSLFLIILIFGSGLAIFVWNLMLGKDLSKPPTFDLSAYDDMSSFDEIRENLIEPQMKPEEEVAPPVEIVEDVVEVVDVDKVELESGKIYFKDSFRLNTAFETTELIASFLEDFDGFEEVVVKNIEAEKVLEIELPALKREELIAELEANEQIEKVAMLEPPVWQVELKTELYEPAVVDMFTPYNGVVINTVFDSKKDFIAEIDLTEVEITDEVLDKLESEYSDVLEIVRP